ncbi:hypothetical protein VitviT2T_008694 [Vitis vinifera]|uniref:Uncharacterized protein n=1 Tax=Vitis vinifera TaxID=29760 RepID=A0ABY9C3D2_VITVI|nr:hypothetical protein VitviT2T_008694 [Vitis vinifera]
MNDCHANVAPSHYLQNHSGGKADIYKLGDYDAGWRIDGEAVRRQIDPTAACFERGGAPRAIPREMDELDSKIEPLLALQCPQPKKMKRSPL